MWIARDKNGSLNAYHEKVERSKCKYVGIKDIWVRQEQYKNKPTKSMLILKKSIYSEITWETEPKWVRFIPEDYIIDILPF